MFKKNIFVPAEWEYNKLFIGWPEKKSLWQEHLYLAQDEIIAVIKELLQEVNITICAKNICLLKERLKQENDGNNIIAKINFFSIALGDIWLRDTAPFNVNIGNINKALAFAWNGWGNKYNFPEDIKVAQKLASFNNLRIFKQKNLVIEGGAVEHNGCGTAILTKECLLNHNRNPQISQSYIEQQLKKLMGFKNFIWLSKGMLNDHTDGHIDNIARFISHNRLVIMKGLDKYDPNTELFKNIKAQLESYIKNNPAFKNLELIEISSPIMVKDKEGNILPASHLNFIIAGKKIIMPSFAYNKANKKAVEKAIMELQRYTNKKVISLPCDNILSGGGAFHCLSWHTSMLAH